MKTFLANIKQSGLANAVSIATVDGYYNVKTKMQMATLEKNAEKLKKSLSYEEDSDDDHCSLGFAKALGFETAEECDEYFERWEQEEREVQERECEQEKDKSEEIELSSTEIKRNLIARCLNLR